MKQTYLDEIFGATTSCRYDRLRITVNSVLWIENCLRGVLHTVPKTIIWIIQYVSEFSAIVHSPQATVTHVLKTPVGK